MSTEEQSQTLNECTCGRNYGMTQEENEDKYLDSIFGKDTRTLEEKEADLKDEIRMDKKALEEQKEYLTKHDVDFSHLDDEDIYKTYRECLENNMTDDEREESVRQTALNRNVMRIMFGY